MIHMFTATLLLERSWALQADDISREISALVPEIDNVVAVPGQGENRDQVLFSLDDTQVIAQLARRPTRKSSFKASDHLITDWYPQAEIDAHLAHINIWSTGQAGVERADSYAAAVQIVAAAISLIAPISAAYWQTSGMFSRPEELEAAARPMMNGSLPSDFWVGYSPLYVEGHLQGPAVGIITHGLRQFLGREIELAPHPDSVERAHRCLASIARRILNKALDLQDGERLDDVETTLAATVRKRDYWFRRDHSAFVLVTDDAVIDEASTRSGRRSAA